MELQYETKYHGEISSDRLYAGNQERGCTQVFLDIDGDAGERERTTKGLKSKIKTKKLVTL